MPLSPQSCEQLVRVVIGAGDGIFESYDSFETFLADRDMADMADMADGDPDTAKVRKVVLAINGSGIEKLLDNLREEISYTNRLELLKAVEELIDEVRPDETQSRYFVHWLKHTNEEIAVRESGAFEAFREADWAAPDLDKSRNPKDIESAIDQAHAFVGVVSSRYIRTQTHPPVFKDAFESWVDSVRKNDAPHKFAVILVDGEAKECWKRLYEKRVPEIGRQHCAVVQVTVVPDGSHPHLAVGDAQRIKEALAALIAPQPSPGTAAVGRIVLLEDLEAPTADPPAATGIAALGSTLRTYYGDTIDIWNFGWKHKPLALADQEQLLKINPLFVREVADPAATPEAARASLHADLTAAFQNEALPRSWDEIKERMRRLLWRPNGGAEWATADEREFDLFVNWQMPDAASLLANFAGLKVRKIRFERPLVRDPISRNAINSNLVPILQEVARTGPRKSRTETKDIYLDNIEQTIGDFALDELNILALHNLDPINVRGASGRQTTLQKYISAERKIGDALQKVRRRNRGMEPPILRIAILLRDAHLFDGYSFPYDDAVLDWRFLKWDTSGIEPQFDRDSIDRLQLEAAVLAQTISPS